MTSPVLDLLTDLEWEVIRGQRVVRIEIGSQSLYWFFHLYFGHYIHYPTAPFQKEMMALASDSTVEQLVIMAFRESGKSTIITTAFPIWAIIGHLQKKFVVIVSQTQYQAQQHLSNIKRELAENDILRKDYWPYDYEQNELGVAAINLPKQGARIVAVSREQGVRGLRHGPHRPDLIIADDVEDSQSVRTSDGRNRTFAWFTGELLPLGGDNTKFIVIGNLLHEDSLLMRLRAGIESGQRNGIFRAYPIEQDDVPLWPERYPDKTALQRLESRIADPIRFEREYRLHLVPDEEQIIRRDMLHFYPELPPLLRNQHQELIVGVDLAISERSTADYTAMVTLDVRGSGNNLRIYIRPHPINERMGFPATVDTIKHLNATLDRPKFYVESTGYQEALVQIMQESSLHVGGVKPVIDKRSRLNMISNLIEKGTILFPEYGCEKLVEQLIGFGVEKYDDLVDALTMAVLEVMDHPPQTYGSFHWDRKSLLPNIGHIGSGAHSRRGRGYWNMRLDDFEEATSGAWD